MTFEPEPRRLYLKLLGYDTDELAKKVEWRGMRKGGVSSIGRVEGEGRRKRFVW